MCGVALNYTALYQPCKHTAGERDAKKIPPPDTGSGAFLNESNPSGICARSMRCGLLFTAYFRAGRPASPSGSQGRFHLLHQRGEQLRQLLCGQLLCHYSSQIFGMGHCRLKGAGIGLAAADKNRPHAGRPFHQTVQHRKKSSVPSICAPRRWKRPPSGPSHDRPSRKISMICCSLFVRCTWYTSLPKVLPHGVCPAGLCAAHRLRTLCPKRCGTADILIFAEGTPRLFQRCIEPCGVAQNFVYTFILSGCE